MTDAEAVRRLLELGMTPGAALRILATVELAIREHRSGQTALVLHVGRHRITGFSVSEEWHFPVSQS